MKVSAHFPVIVLAALVGPWTAWAQESNLQLSAEHFDTLRKLIRPGPDEARWAQVSWMPANNIWAARKKAAEEGKPLFLWYMAGEPLGTC